MEQAGPANIGSSSTNVMQATVIFAEPFTSLPVVAANTLQNDPEFPSGINDTFAVSITSVTTTQFTANICRVDIPGNGWGQDLFLGYNAITP